MQKKEKTMESLTNAEVLNLEGTEKKAERPSPWTVLVAMESVLSLLKAVGLTKDFWEMSKDAMDFLTAKLGLTAVQVLFVAIMAEQGEPMTWKKFACHMKCSRLTVMAYTEEVENLLRKRWARKKILRDRGAENEAIELLPEVVTALRFDQVFVPEKIDGLTLQVLVGKVNGVLGDGSGVLRSMRFEDVVDWLKMLCEANPELPLCREALRFDAPEIMLLMMVVSDYASWGNMDNEGLGYGFIDDLFPADYECNFVRESLCEGYNVLLRRGWLEHKCEGGMANNNIYVLTEKAKKKLLKGFKPRTVRKNQIEGESDVLSSTKIKEKTLYYNAAEEEQVVRLARLLGQDSLKDIQKRLEDEGMRKGFACLFYGAPGTGKTETVLQIARQTGRAIMQIDIASMRDKYVGESEKNIKNVFSRYREMCRKAKVMPILFFNEADAIFNKRSENTERAVDKMENSIQNIILQEMENLDGILIATTNLTSNLDKAFDRRFLYKVKFCKPEAEVKAKIWKEMLKDLSEEDARTLAEEFDFSGGQIENVARKRTVDYILNGEKVGLEGIESYCRMELMDGAPDRRVVGFRV